MTPSVPVASSSTAGFFQSSPHIENQYQEDAGLRRVLDLYLPSPVQHSVCPDLSRFGSLVLTRQVLDWVADAEKNVPYLRTWDSFGKRKDDLVTSEGWRRLQELGQAEGIVAIPYENKIGPYSRVHQFLKYHLWTGSCAYVTCPSAMTDGAACLLSTHLSNSNLPTPLRPVLSSALSRLTSRDPSQAWTSGQWMTERSGGSDISGTETIATKFTETLNSTGIDGAPLGPWSISGFKWFSSATDAQMAILLARTPDNKISAFYAPLRRTILSESEVKDKSYSPKPTPNTATFFVPVQRTPNSEIQAVSSLTPYTPQPMHDISSFYASSRNTLSSPSPSNHTPEIQLISSLTPYNPHNSAKSPSIGTLTELNGISIQRLKSKLGTRALPTAELELSGLRAHLLGSEGNGIREISTILNITRVHNSVTAMGLWGRGLAISRAFARVREVGGRKLSEVPAHVRTMANQEVQYRGYMQLTFFVVLLLGITEQDSSHSYVSPASPFRQGSGALEKITPRFEDAKILLRLLTPVIKALTAKASIAGLSECMESLGGVGYLENEEMEFNIARLFRDANVLSIWEGTTDIMAADVVKVLKGKQGAKVLSVLENWVTNAAPGVGGERWKNWKGKVEKGKLETLMVDGRDVMGELGRLVTGVLLVVDCERDGDETAREVAGRWVTGGLGGPKTTVEGQVAWDRKIVFGGDIGKTSKL